MGKYSICLHVWTTTPPNHVYYRLPTRSVDYCIIVRCTRRWQCCHKGWLRRYAEA